MKQGDYVIVRTYGGKTRRVRVWEETPDAIYIHDDDNYDRHQRGVTHLAPVAFPRKDVRQLEDERRTED